MKSLHVSDYLQSLFEFSESRHSSGRLSDKSTVNVGLRLRDVPIPGGQLLDGRSYGARQHYEMNVRMDWSIDSSVDLPTEGEEGDEQQEVEEDGKVTSERPLKMLLM